MIQILWQPLMRHFQTFDKIDCFLKKVSNDLYSKKGSLYLWRTAQFTYNCWLIFFFIFHGEFQNKIEPSWRNFLIWTADWDRRIHRMHLLLYFLIPIATMQGSFCTKDNFCFICDCRNSFNCKLKKLTNEQKIIFYSPSMHFVHLTNAHR